VKPWTGLTVEGPKVDDAGRVSFSAGPRHEIKEPTVRGTDLPPLNKGNAPVPFSIGPVDFPDVAKDQKATGARFLTNVRGYSASSPSEVEHYCLDCSFRPWLDATGDVIARVTIGSRTETVKPDAAGRFVTKARLDRGQTARIALEDAWGDTTAAPVAVSG
jgi:hypothetical protein